MEKIEIDGHELFYTIQGKGNIPIIMESGWGSGAESWLPIFNQLSEETMTFSYARPGYNGRLDDGNPKTASFVAANLRKTLRKLKIKGPYILVGHSLGGMYMEYFAKNFPDEVAALVLVDSRHKDFSKACKENSLEAQCLPPQEMLDKAPDYMRKEMVALPEIESELNRSPQFGDYPIYILTGAKVAGPEQKKLIDLWVKSQKDFATEKDTIIHKISKKAGHAVHHDHPELVIKSIIEAVRSVKTDN